MYFLLHNNFLYPPKYILSIANLYANNIELDATKFHGGIEANMYLESLGFNIVKKPFIEKGQKWLAVTSEENWKRCLENHVWGAEDNRAQQLKKIEKNDEIVIYLAGMKLAAICKVSKEYYYDDTKIWQDGIYPHRVQIEPVKIPSTPIDIKKIYHVYLGYKGSPGGYFGQAIRPLPNNEFSIFQSELARNMNELAKWDKSDVLQDFATPLKVYLENKFSINLIKKRSHIFFNSGAVIHVRGSKIHFDGTGFYYLQQKDYEDTIKNTDRFFVIVFGKVDTVFIIPSEKLKEIFKDQPVVKRDTEEPKWYFDVFENNDKKHFLRIHSNSSSNVFDIENYLNKWEQIPELNIHIQKDENQDQMIANENEAYVFVTGYNDENLRISKQSHILGWTRNSNFLSKDSLVFVFDKTNLYLDSCFRIKSKSDNNELIWADEIKSGKLIYPNRWKAELNQDSLKIPLADINGIPPFDKEPFQGLLRGNFPMPLNSPQNKDKYETFRKFILDKLINYWIFIVADQPKFKLSAEEIYQTRMNDKFWGLNEHTPYRKQLKRGDLVIFCHGAKKFLGTGKLETNCFEPTEEQKIKFSHNIDFYKPKYGVMLSEIERWQKPKEVVEYVSNLSFIPNIQQFSVYFQGGIKKIRASDYNLITNNTLTNHIDKISEGNELLLFDDDEPLSLPDPKQLEAGYEKISEILLIPNEKVIEIVTALISGRHVLLAGPIGTGKTRLATMIPEVFWENIGGYRADTYTATADWNTQDVIGGIYPKMENGKVVYDIQYGCVVETVTKNWEHGINGGRHTTNKTQRKMISGVKEIKPGSRGTWLIIDEFNRADIDKAFGQLFTSLRTRSLKIPTNDIGSSYKDLRIPKDYRIIGTLNTADKHFLFQLSDALKSRFAYIEVDIPSRKDYKKEIYYALKNAIDELALKAENYQDFILLDVANREVLAGKLNSDFYNFVLQAYYYLDSVRAFKKLGTAILQIIYQNMLVAIRITNDAKSSLDNALTSTLLPQLENLPLASLGAIEVFYNEVRINEKDKKIGEYFKDAYKNPNRQSFIESFEKVLRYLELDKYEKIIDEFAKGILKIDNDNLWTNIESLFVNKKKNFDSDLVNFKHGITDLRKSAVI